MNSSNYLLNTRLNYGSTTFQKKESPSESFQQKFDYLNQKLDYQLKLSSEIGLRAEQTRKNYIFPKTFQDFGRTRAYTPERLNSRKELGIIMSGRSPDGYSEGFTPPNRGKETEKAIKAGVFKHETTLNEKPKKSSPIPNCSPSKKNVDINEKIRVIYENLGIDMEDILDRIFDLTDCSPSNPLKKVKGKPQKSSGKIPENETKSTDAFRKILNINENVFQTPQISNTEMEIKTDLVANSVTNPSEIINEPKIKENFSEKKNSLVKDSRETEKKLSMKEKGSSKEKKQKNLISEIKMDVNKMLDCLYSNTLANFELRGKIQKDNEQKHKHKQEVSDYEVIVRNELESLYESLVAKTKT